LKWSSTFYGLRHGWGFCEFPWIERGGGAYGGTSFLNGYFSENGFSEESCALYPSKRYKAKSKVSIHGKAVFLIDERNDGISAEFPHQIK
jgi:hypothetical protein